jgi:choline-sulfatase
MEPANLLLITSDEHSPKVVGCYGNSVVRTPNIDGLAARGVRFERAYCQTPICVPSRASFATGRYAHAIDNWDNSTPYVGTEADSWGHRLTEQGHPVTTIGKLHYRKVGDPSGFPDQRLAMHVLDGVGDLFGALRGRMPLRPQSRRPVELAGPGDAEYTRYDRAIAAEAARWLHDEGKRPGKPWALHVSFTNPHFPLMAPAEFVDMYAPDSIPMPPQWRFADWPRHPALEAKRHMQTLDRPFDEATLRRAIAVYYAMVSFVDAQIGAVLDALADAGLTDRTRVIYTSDHGDMIGEKGLWWKSIMYEASVAVPMVIAGPGIPAGRTSRTNAMLVDLFPSIVESVGARASECDRDLPGTSLFQLATEPDRDRVAFSEYHAIFSSHANYMVRLGPYKYIRWIGYPDQLFDLDTDPDEERDLIDDPAHQSGLRACRAALAAIGDPDEIDARAHAAQARTIAAAGGDAAVIANGVRIPYTPAPTEFAPANPG